MSRRNSSSTHAAWLPRREMEELRNSLEQVQDAQLVKFVVMVDGMRDRGFIDDLVAPFRPRLALLRPARPLRFIRLLFTPLDPVIVHPAAWRVDSPALPRTALPALADAAHSTMGGEAAQIDAMIAGHTTNDVSVIARAGALLWPSAAQALLRSSLPAGWSRTGLPDPVFHKLAARIAAVLDQALALQALRAETELGAAPSSGAVRMMLRQVSAGIPDALGLLIALILARVPQAAATLRETGMALGGEVAAAVRQALERAEANLLERLELDGGAESLVLGADIAEAGAAVRRVTELLHGLEADGSRRQAQRTEAIRRRLDASCRTRFATGLRTELLESLEKLGPAPEELAVIRLEEVARGLRALGAEGRGLGSGELYDRLLRQTTCAIKAISPEGALTIADRVRLVEILAGPEEAWSMLAPAAA